LGCALLVRAEQKKLTMGGGYIFVHRMLLEYFAELTTHSPKAEDGQKPKGVGENLG
jgi:hypothetical protein